MYPQFPLPTNCLPGYSFNQISNSLIEIIYEFPSPTAESDIKFSYNKDNNSIFLAITNQDDPILCGVLTNPINDATPLFSESAYKITLSFDPSEENSWDLLIKASSNTGIDPKSEFLLGAEANNKQNYEEAFKLISSAAEKKYIPAMQALIDIYSLEESPYKDHYNLEESTKILKQLFDMTEDPDAGVRLATIYRSLKHPEEAKQILERCADKSDEAKLMLAVILSPLTGELNEPERAVQILRELADNNSMEAISALIPHYQKGVGTPVDLNEVKRLKRELIRMQSRRFGQEHKNIFIGLAAAAVVCASAVGIALFLRRRGHK
ncbi:hypothetical protein M9Y10_030852 [Tritrichomonas musculus]|uniref:Uncharacterized protein n=1 Tax=Tritrichomonas musculus TaxID=1915356 RepID=A0ABR2H3F4_9EUKA